MAKKNKAYKFKLEPTSEQRNLINRTFGSARFVYNRMLDDRIKSYEEYKNDKSEFKKMKFPTPAAYKKDYPFLKEVDSLALANAQMNLDKAYKAFFTGQNKFPTFKSRKTRKSYTTNVVNGNIMVQDGYIKLPKLKWVKLKQHRQIPEGHVLKSATISMTASGKYYVSLLTEYEFEPVKAQSRYIVGLDFSMHELFVASDGTRAKYPRFYRQMLDKLAKEQRTLSRRKKGSNRWFKQKNKVAKLHEKVANQRKDYLHKESRKMADKYDIVGIEDLNMKDMSRALKFGKSVHDNGWGMFTAFLYYKLDELGKKLVKVDKWFPSSKMCSKCGVVKHNFTLFERLFSCSCGHKLDRDENAAINIEKETKRLLAEPLVT
jgi:putative transposase